MAKGNGCCSCSDPDEKQKLHNMAEVISLGLMPGAEEEDKTKRCGGKVRCCTDWPVSVCVHILHKRNTHPVWQWLLLFIGFCFGMLIVMVLASEKADLNRWHLHRTADE